MIRNLISLYLFLAIIGAPAHAKFITGFKTDVTRIENGSVIFRAVPNAYDMHRPTNTKNWKVWGVLLCYTVDGERKGKRQDMTYDIMKDGFYTFTMAYSKNSSVTNIDVEFFEVSQPKESWPDPSSC